MSGAQELGGDEFYEHYGFRRNRPQEYSEERIQRKLRDIARQAAVCRDIVSSGEAAFFEYSQQGLMRRTTAVHSVEVIAEAARGIHSDWKLNRTHVPWRLLNSMRNRLSHEYGDVDFDIVWRTITWDIPRLRGDLGLPDVVDPYEYL